MASKEPPVDPPASKWCALCERELTEESEYVPVRGLTVCMRCWKQQPRRGRNAHG